MHRANTVTSQLVLVAVFLLPFIWMALHAAPALSEGLPALLLQLSTAMEHPFRGRYAAQLAALYGGLCHLRRSVFVLVAKLPQA